MQPVAVSSCNGPHGDAATSPNSRQERPFRPSFGIRSFIVHTRQQGKRLSVVGPALNRQRTLANRRDALLGAEHRRNSLMKPEATQSRDGDDQAIELPLVQLAEASVNVSPDPGELEIRTERPELCNSSRTARRQYRACRHVGE